MPKSKQPPSDFDCLPPLDIEVIPEPVDARSASGASNAQTEDPSVSLDDYKLRRLESEIADLAQQLRERKDLHDIRRKHAWLLFLLTIAWISIIWITIFMQGFGKWLFPYPAFTANLSFHLSDTVIVAFMTSTTATVLGLYGIAAYWLYGKKSGDGKTKKAKLKKNSKPPRKKRTIVP